jgi:hypothetical protein
MPISLQTNFDVFSNYPIDSRMVVDTISLRNAIEYKYEGLKVFVKSDQTSYIWNGTSWIIDGSNIGGIYGGSGSLPSDVGVFFGTVSTTLNSSSNRLYKWASSVTDDQNYIYDYFYRRAAGDDYDTLAFRTEQKLRKTDGTFLQGPFIEYNGTEPRLSSLIGSLVLGVPNLSTNGFGSKLVITPNNLISFYTSIDPSTELPMTISRLNSQTFLGFNFNPITNSASPTFNTYDGTKNAYRIKFGVNGVNELTFETKLGGNYSWQEALKIDNVDLNSASVKYSPVKLLTDTSGRDWDGISNKSWSLQSVEEILRNSENKFTKTQMWGQGTVDNPSIVNNTLYLKNDGNSFNVKLGANEWIKDIRMSKSGSYRDFPNGTLLTIKFINTDTSNPGYLKVLAGSNLSETNLPSKIYSDITDAIFSGNDETRLTIDYLPVPDRFGGNLDAGDIMMFRRIDNIWEVVTVNRMRKLVTKISSISTSTTWQFKPLTYLNNFTSTGNFRALGSSTVGNLTTTSIGNHPSKFVYSETAIGNPKDETNFDNYKLRFTVDGNKLVYAQGNFRITLNGIDSTPGTNLTSITSTQNIFWEQQGRENIFRIGEISDITLKPQMESIYSPAIAYGQGDLLFTEPFISISSSGVIFFSFKLKLNKSNPELKDYLISNNTLIDVWVPPFSYTATYGSVTK